MSILKQRSDNLYNKLLVKVFRVELGFHEVITMGLSFKLEEPSSTFTRNSYDVVVIGGGPAGLTAALYLARYNIDAIVITKVIGGHMAEATIVDDYPGLPDIPGSVLVDKFVSHVRKYGVPIVIDEVVNLWRDDKEWFIETKLGRRYRALAVILAIGSEKRKLGVPGEKEFLGRGVSYCATCDGPLFRGKIVAVIGGGNAAFVSALYLASIAKRVYLIHRRREFRALPVYVERAKGNPRIVFLLNKVVKEITGDERVRGLRIVDRETGSEDYIEVDGVFIEIGLEPPVDFLKKIGLELDSDGRVKAGVDKSTNLPGLYVAGDIAGGECKYRFEQIIVAAAEGAIAADAVFKYVMRIKAIHT